MCSLAFVPLLFISGLVLAIYQQRSYILLSCGFTRSTMPFSIFSAIPMGEYYYSLMIYIRNQFMGCTLLMSCIQVKTPARQCRHPLIYPLYNGSEGIIIQRFSDPRFPCIPPYLWAMGNHHYGVP